ncbi:MAG: HAD family phosphatase [Ruminococcaceae bacterium]|nr:HAD family phosphatase [Oscillospiraceae bacterium]
MYAVVFDMDGVILDTENLGIAAWRKAGVKYGISEDEINRVYRLIIGTKVERGNEIIRENFGKDFPSEDFRKECGSYIRDVLNTKIPLRPFAREILEFLKNNGIKVALASSTKYEIVMRELTQEGLIGYFDVIIGGDLVAKSKPEPDIFLKAIADLGETPENCFIVEDSVNGIRAAHASGAKPIMVPDLVTPTEEIKALCHKIFDSLGEVMEYLGTQK